MKEKERDMQPHIYPSEEEDNIKLWGLHKEEKGSMKGIETDVPCWIIIIHNFGLKCSIESCPVQLYLFIIIACVRCTLTYV